MTTPRHPKIPKFLEMGLFNDLQSFGELESRIEGLEPEKEKGDAFEVFALAYISSSIGKKLLQASDDVRNVSTVRRGIISIKSCSRLPASSGAGRSKVCLFMVSCCCLMSTCNSFSLSSAVFRCFFRSSRSLSTA